MPQCLPQSSTNSPSIVQAKHTSTVKALYDYEANAPGELSVKEDEVLLVFDKEDAWLLVQLEGGKAGFVPENYTEVCSISCIILCAIMSLQSIGY